MTVRHVVLWRLTAEDPVEKADQCHRIRERFLALRPHIPEIHSMQVGANVLAVERNWDLVLIADFADLFSLERYMQHPEHQKVAAYVGTLTKDRSSIDFEPR